MYRRSTHTCHHQVLSRTLTPFYLPYLMLSTLVLLHTMSQHYDPPEEQVESLLIWSLSCSTSVGKWRRIPWIEQLNMSSERQITHPWLVATLLMIELVNILAYIATSSWIPSSPRRTSHHNATIPVPKSSPQSLTSSLSSPSRASLKFPLQ